MSKKPLICFITDTHVVDSNIPLVESIFDQCIEYCIEHNIKYVGFLGDFFTQRDKQSLECLLCLYRILIRFKKAGIMFLAIQGNHDKTSLVSKYGYMSIYKKQMTLFEDEGSIEIEGIQFCFLPYFKEGEEYNRRLENLANSSDDSKVLLTHIAINGVRNNDGSVVNKGVDIQLFDFFDKIFVGHYHDKQSLGHNVYYIGSGYQGNFGEDENKGLTIFYSDYSHKQIRTSFPSYKKKKIPATDKQEIQKFITLNQNSEDKVRLIITGSREDLSVSDRSMLAGIDIDVKFESEQTESMNTKEFAQENIVVNKKDLPKYWLNYCKANKVEKEVMFDGLKMLK